MWTRETRFEQAGTGVGCQSKGVHRWERGIWSLQGILQQGTHETIHLQTNWAATQGIQYGSNRDYGGQQNGGTHRQLQWDSNSIWDCNAKPNNAR